MLVCHRYLCHWLCNSFIKIHNGDLRLANQLNLSKRQTYKGITVTIFEKLTTPSPMSDMHGHASPACTSKSGIIAIYGVILHVDKEEEYDEAIQTVILEFMRKTCRYI